MVKILDINNFIVDILQRKVAVFWTQIFANDSLLVRKLVKRQVSIKGSPDCLLLFLSGSPII